MSLSQRGHKKKHYSYEDSPGVEQGPREVVSSPSNLGWPEPWATWWRPSCPCSEQEVGPETSQGPFQPELSCEPLSAFGLRYAALQSLHSMSHSVI